MANAEISFTLDEDSGTGATSEAQYSAKIQAIGNRLNAANNLGEALINLKDEICELFGADRITVYVVDGVKRELVSRFKSGNEVTEIRIPVAQTSVAGYAALKQTLLNIKDVYDQKELTAIDPELQFDSSWDRRTGYRTKTDSGASDRLPEIPHGYAGTDQSQSPWWIRWRRRKGRCRVVQDHGRGVVQPEAHRRTGRPFQQVRLPAGKPPADPERVEQGSRRSRSAQRAGFRCPDEGLQNPQKGNRQRTGKIL